MLAERPSAVSQDEAGRRSSSWCHAATAKATKRERSLHRKDSERERRRQKIGHADKGPACYDTRPRRHRRETAGDHCIQANATSGVRRQKVLLSNKFAVRCCKSLTYLCMQNPPISVGRSLSKCPHYVLFATSSVTEASS